MKNIIRIFRRDLHRLGTNALALVIIAGVTLLPALYAWFNIAANWDPYSNTGGIKVAVANEDAGTKLEGITTNLGNEIVTNLKGNAGNSWTATMPCRASRPGTTTPPSSSPRISARIW